MRALQSDADQTEARSSRFVRYFFSFVVLFGRGPLIRGLLSLGGPCVAAPPSAKDRPGSGMLVFHWPKNDAYPYLAPGQNETLRERSKSADNAASGVSGWSEGVVVVVISVKENPIKITPQRMNI